MAPTCLYPTRSMPFLPSLQKSPPLLIQSRCLDFTREISGLEIELIYIALVDNERIAQNDFAPANLQRA